MSVPAETSDKAIVEATALVYLYPGVRALDEVSFSLPQGSITALVGPNGAGKTTLLRCLATLEEPFSGSIRIAGRDVVAAPRETHRRLGYLSDHFGLYAELSVERCLLYAGRARGVETEALSQRIPQLAIRLGLSELLPRLAGGLSRGQRQRLAIGQAIIHDPAVLLLDEPASGLDPESRGALSALMRSLQDGGMSLVVSSHILAELEEYCTGMLVMDRGRILEHRQLRTAQANAERLIRLRLSAPLDGLPEILRQMPGIFGIYAENNAATFRSDRDDTDLAEVLARLLAAGAPVCEFVVGEESLQDAYLDVVAKSRGAV